MALDNILPLLDDLRSNPSPDLALELEAAILSHEIQPPDSNSEAEFAAILAFEVSQPETINGTSDNDIIVGTNDADRISGLEGNDGIFGLAGDDQIFGGFGVDIIIGGGGNDQLFGEDDNDVIFGDVQFFAEGGNDFVSGGNGDDVLFGGTGNDTLNGDDGDDNLNGDDGDDQLLGGNGFDVLFGGNGNDEVRGGNGDDRLFSDAGNDQLFGEDGDDIINGADGEDVAFGGNGNDRFFLGSGNDNVFGEDGNDLADGESGDDLLVGGNGDDILFGSIGDDTLVGDAGVDVLVSGVGSDSISGGAGDDVVIGVDPFVPAFGFGGIGGGVAPFEIDTLTGGEGSDLFFLGDNGTVLGITREDGPQVYYVGGGNSDYALITDFNLSEDVIQLPATSLLAASFSVSVTEFADAGQLLSNAQVIPSGSATLNSISGTLSSDNDVDLFRITLGDAPFFATTVGGADFDTQLFLFNESGVLVDEMTISAPQAPGNYFLAISSFNNDPAGTPPIFSNSGFFSGSYTIALTGVQATPFSFGASPADLPSGTAISFENDLIAILQGVSPLDLSLDSSNFAFV